MRITNIQNSKFSHAHDKPQHAQATNAQNHATDEPKQPSTSRELVALQPTEYKRFNSQKLNSSNPFLAQYISQNSSQKRRAFIGRKPAWQAKKSYENAANILENATNPYLNKSI